MTKAEKLNSIYKAILETLDITADETGLLSSDVGPITVQDKRLALPTREVLSQLHDGKLVAFHPLSENLFLGLSPVLQATRSVVMMKLSDVITTAVYVLLTIRADNTLCEKLTAGQAEKMAYLVGADDKLLANFKKLVNDVLDNSNHRAVNIVLRRGSELKGVKYSRAAHVSFPLLQEISRSEDGTVFGVKFRKKDLGVLRAAFELVIPNGLEEDHYSAGSNSNVAPYFSSLIKAYATVLAGTAGVTWGYRKMIEELQGRSLHVTPDSILKAIEGEESFESLANAIKPLPLNMGDKDQSPTNVEEQVEQAVQSVVEDVIREAAQKQEDKPVAKAPPRPTRQVEKERTPPQRPNRGYATGRSFLDNLPRVKETVTQVDEPVEYETTSSRRGGSMADSLLNRGGTTKRFGSRDRGRGYDNDGTSSRGRSIVDRLPRI